jgi:hypothetical protein
LETGGAGELEGHVLVADPDIAAIFAFHVLALVEMERFAALGADRVRVGLERLAANIA